MGQESHCKFLQIQIQWLLFVVALMLTACSSMRASADELPTPVVAAAVPREYAATATAPSLAEDVSDCSQQSRSSRSPVRIGLLAPTSKSAAYQAGLSMVASAEYARDDINHREGILDRPFQIIVGDTEGDPVAAARVVKRMITEECVVGLVGGYHSQVALEIKEIAHQYGIPIIFAEAYDDAITVDEYPEVFRISPSSEMVNSGFAQWFQHIGDFNQDGQTVVTVVAENTPGGIERLARFATTLEQYNISLKPFLVDLPTTEFASLIARLVSLDQMPDFILVWFNSESGYALLQQLHQAAIGPDTQTIVVARQPALSHEFFWQKLPDGIDMVVSKIGPWNRTVTELGRSFASRYQADYDFWPESYAFGAYDAVWLMADAINRAGTTDAKTLIMELEASDIELAAGRYCFPSPNSPPDVCPSPYGPMWHQWPGAQLLLLQYTEKNQSSADMEVLWPLLHQTAEFTVHTYP